MSPEREEPGRAPRPGRPGPPAGQPRRPSSPPGGRPPQAPPVRRGPHPSEAPTEPIPLIDPGPGPARGQGARTSRAGAPPSGGAAASRSGEERASRAGRRGSGRRRGRRGLRVFVVLALLALPFVLGVGWFAYQMRPGSEGRAVTVTLTKDMGTAEVADLLASKGVIDSALAFRIWATVAGPGPYDAGPYAMHEGQGVRAALSILKEGQQVALQPDVKLLLPPGLTVAQIAERVGTLPGRSAAKFLEIAQSNTVRSRYQPPEVTSLEGLLFPDTYFIGATESEEAILRRLVDRFDEIGDKIGLANAQAFTPYETVIAASLIQTEAKLAEDAPLIGAVIRNRIADGMQLQIDSTLCYSKGGCPPSPTDADKALDSPYNTYRIAGLPPTPIASVTEASLVAALNPADVPYKFYVLSDANGKHAFATTLAEHDRNVAAARAKGLL